MLKTVRTLLIVLFTLALAGAGGLFYYNHAHEDSAAPYFKADSDLLEVSVHAEREALCQGLHAYDEADGDLSSQIMIQSTSELINETDILVSYIVFDSSSNYATYQRTIRFTDYTPPTFSLSKPLVFRVGEQVSFLDRISAYDVRDGNITGRITLRRSTVINNTPGSYEADLSVTNRLGDTVSLPLTVSVISGSASMPQIELSSYLIYVERGSVLRYSDYLHSVTDPLDPEEISSLKVRVNARDADLNTPGVYEVYYYYTGVSGETASVILTVIVQ